MAENILSGMFPVVFTGQASSTVDHKLRSGNGFAPDRIKKNYGLPDFLRGTPPLYRYSAVSGFFLSHSGISCVSVARRYCVDTDSMLRQFDGGAFCEMGSRRLDAAIHGSIRINHVGLVGSN